MRDMKLIRRGRRGGEYEGSGSRVKSGVNVMREGMKRITCTELYEVIERS